MPLKLGDTASFVRDEIVDWIYMDGSAMKGNYSARAILKKDRQAFMRRFGLNLDF